MNNDLTEIRESLANMIMQLMKLSVEMLKIAKKLESWTKENPDDVSRANENPEKP